MSTSRLNSATIVVLVAVGIAAVAGGAFATDALSDRPAQLDTAVEHNVSFDVSNLSVEDDEQLAVSADIDNPGSSPAIQPVELRVDGELVEQRLWALNPGETERITFDVGAGQIEDGDVVSVQTRTHGDVVVFEETPPPAGPSVTFEDQTSDGSSVVVANASNTETPYYVAVWTLNDSTGEPQSLLGASQVTTNDTSNLTVGLEPAITENQTLIAAVHPDADGNASTIDPVTDDIRASDTANVTVEAVEPPTDATIQFEDQSSDGSSVVVAESSNPEAPYYTAIWTVNDSSGEPETLLGAAQVTENQSTNSTVALDPPITENQTLIAAVHPDADGNASTIDPVTDDIRASDTANVTVEAVEPPTDATIQFEDQSSDGSSVVVANASNDETPYYAAVWTVNDSTGEPETLLGAAQVEDNETSDLQIDFETSIDESQTLVAAVHPDGDANASTFDPVVTEIRASDTANVTIESNGPAEPSLTFEDQTSDGTSVQVAAASYDQPPYYVAIYDFNESGGMDMVGLQQVTETAVADLTVTLDEPLAESGTVVAAIHPDADGDAGTVDPVTGDFLTVTTANVTVETATTTETTTTG